jgi:hypothetical protein
MDRLTIPPRQMDLAIAVISATLTAPILAERHRFTVTAGREPFAAEMEILPRLVLTEWSLVMQQIRRVER